MEEMLLKLMKEMEEMKNEIKALKEENEELYERIGDLEGTIIEMQEHK